MDVVDSLFDHFHDKQDIFIWFDLFSNNQHSGNNIKFDDLCKTFKSAIKQFGHTVMVMSPWDNPVILTRGWCLFELFCTADSKSEFSIAMSKKDHSQFLNEVLRDPIKSVNKVYGRILTLW